MKLIILAIGGAAGTLLRYGTGRLLPPGAWPWATLLANIAGSFLIGLFAACMLRLHWPKELELALIVGLCGGFTTFSAFSLENIKLLEQGYWLRAVGYSVATVVGSLLACWLGKRLGQ